MMLIFQQLRNMLVLGAHGVHAQRTAMVYRQEQGNALTRQQSVKMR